MLADSDLDFSLGFDEKNLSLVAVQRSLEALEQRPSHQPRITEDTDFSLPGVRVDPNRWYAEQEQNSRQLAHAKYILNTLVRAGDTLKARLCLDYLDRHNLKPTALRLGTLYAETHPEWLAYKDAEAMTRQVVERLQTTVDNYHDWVKLAQSHMSSDREEQKRLGFQERGATPFRPPTRWDSR